MSLTNSIIPCYVRPLEYTATNTHTHTTVTTDIQDTLAEFHKSSNLVNVESETKEKLYPIYTQDTQAQTHGCFHVALPEI